MKNWIKDFSPGLNHEFKDLHICSCKSLCWEKPAVIDQGMNSRACAEMFLTEEKKKEHKLHLTSLKVDGDYGLSVSPLIRPSLKYSKTRETNCHISN